MIPEKWYNTYFTHLKIYGNNRTIVVRNVFQFGKMGKNHQLLLPDFHPNFIVIKGLPACVDWDVWFS